MTAELSQGKGPERLEDQGRLLEIGSWYWAKEGGKERFACLVYVGSNYAEFQTIDESSFRVHFKDFDAECRKEEDPKKVLEDGIRERREKVQGKLSEIRELTQRLGLKVGQGQDVQVSASRALSTLSGSGNVKTYEKSLVKAKDKDLPKLFKEMEKANEDLVTWMKAETIHLAAATRGLGEIVEEVEDRIFNISLYAGLTEEVERVRKGKKAKADEKLRIMQRLLYMDEECLLDYRVGGMDFTGIKKFDQWLSKPKNLERLLPFPRCMAAFQVRRGHKERDIYGCASFSSFIDVSVEDEDKKTFLFIRNGGSVYRMTCKLRFDDLIFPGKTELDLSEPMMAKADAFDVDDVIPTRQYDDMLKEETEGHENYKKWKKEHPEKKWRKANPGGTYYFANPFREYSSPSRLDRQYHPFEKSSVYYDDMTDVIEKRVKYYNRIAMIVQGLYDRSMVLHPHPPIQMWDPESFEKNIELIYDGSNTLTHGKPPDFEAYRQELNSRLKVGSVTVGQEDWWMRQEAKKEAYRLSLRGHNMKSDRYRPYGNPGPGFLAMVKEWSEKRRRAVYSWDRERQRPFGYGSFRGDLIETKISVKEEKIFNISAYRPGDYLQFFLDPRTRAEYIQWAPVLLTAEDYHAGRLKVGRESDD